MDVDFTDGGSRTLQKARSHAARRHQKSVEPRHVLLALMDASVPTLERFWPLAVSDPDSLRDVVEGSLPRVHERPWSGGERLPFNDRCLELFDKALSLARGSSSERPGAEELLLALTMEPGMARMLLEQHGVTEAEARAALDGLVEEPPPKPRAPAPVPEPTTPPPGTPSTPGRPRRKPSEPTPSPEELPHGPGRRERPPTRTPIPPTVPPEETPPRPAEPGRPPEKEPDEDPEKPPDRPVPPARWPPNATPSAHANSATHANPAAHTARAKPPAGSPRSGRAAVVELDFLSLDLAARTPLHRQVTQGIQEAVAAGRIPPGARLPSVRAAASALEISPGTAARAYRSLEDDGIVETRGPRGTFVAGRNEDGLTPEERIRLGDAFRAHVVGAALQGATRDDIRAALEGAMNGLV